MTAPITAYLPSLQSQAGVTTMSDVAFTDRTQAILELFNMAFAIDEPVAEVANQTPEQYRVANTTDEHPSYDPRDDDEFPGLRHAYHEAVRLSTADAWEKAYEQLRRLQQDGLAPWKAELRSVRLQGPLSVTLN